MLTHVFDLSGPEFLQFYFLLGVAVNVALRFISSACAPAGSERPHDCLLADPYLAAHLRGGAAEAIRIALISLMDRGLIKTTGSGTIQTDRTADQEAAKRPLEQALLTELQEPRPISSAFSSPSVQLRCDEYENVLRQQGLIATANVYYTRAIWFAAAISVLLGVSFYKLHLAYQRGRHNVLFLILMTAAFSLWAVTIFLRRRTRAGDDTVRSLQRFFSTLKERAGQLLPGGSTNELAYLAAAFGLAVVPRDIFPFVSELATDRAFGAGGSTSGGCAGSGCGGSSCSGGGCGGGCGGCGG